MGIRGRSCLGLAWAAALACAALRAGAPLSAWSFGNLPESPPSREAFFAFAARHNLSEVHLGVGDRLPEKAEALAAFIQEARARGLGVSLALGQDRWTDPRRHGEALAVVEEVVAFVRALRKAGRPLPTALHLDVEPHTQPGWNSDWQPLATSYLDLLAQVKARLDGLPLIVDIPVWWHRLALARSGRTQPLSAWVMDLADTTVLMDYRDRLGPILESAAPDLALARARGRKVVLALNIQREPGASERHTTFARRGAKALEQTLGEVERGLEADPAFGGLAVFTFEAWARGARR